MSRPTLRTRDLRDAPFILVLLIAAGGIGFSAFHWRRGILVVALAALVGAVLRAVLTERQAGLLAVRHRGVDVLGYAALGAAMVLVIALLPHG